MTLAVPTEDEQAYVHDKYMGELVNGIFLPETRERLLEIVEPTEGSGKVSRA